MKKRILTIQSNRALTDTVFEMKLSGIEGTEIRPGQFVNLKLDGLFLRRPISVCDVQGDELTLIFRTVGSGTAMMSDLAEGERLDVLLELGNGYDLSRSGDTPLLIGGGVGIPPLYYLAKELIQKGKQVSVILGFNTRDECFYEAEFRALGADVSVTTADGSYGIRGFVTEALKPCSYFYACGPLPMERALYNAVKAPGEFSLEERMGCGFGACMGCSIETKEGPKRVCKDGPVFRREVLLWND
ncbi:MAG: dihydroorotate dehydrogenase electron transfer subunit [Solobacterium sp.]|nr:dihydroorotate dehydrogenase electron transfer subunit [Solobacterium sp.]